MRQKQRELLQTLYESQQRNLRFTACGKGLPREEADDAVQDTFCRFIDAYGERFDRWNERQIKAALMRILCNRCADYYRNEVLRSGAGIEECGQERGYRVPEEQAVPDVAEYLMAKEKFREVREGISAMSPAVRKVATLCMLESRTVEETCRILDINVPACRMRLSRARRYLAEWLADCDEKDAD